MSQVLTPRTMPELTEMVRATPKLVPVGSGTKPRLSALEVPKVSIAELRGMVEYNPGEFTFTALAGTPVREIAALLAERGQYLPFDPPLVDAGATLGGTVAAGLSGPGRFRFGGVRDFILGIQFVDGLGRLLRAGGKVVKNAAGFDLPKFFVGSCGRFGVLAEMTFKVFPRPADALSLKLNVTDVEAATRMIVEAANSRWQPDALDLLPEGKTICLRLAGPAAGLDELAREILDRWPGQKLSTEEANTIWSELREFRWAHPGGSLVKVPITPAALPGFVHALSEFRDIRLHVSVGGNLAFLSTPGDVDPTALNSRLTTLSLSGLTLRGNGPLWLGVRSRQAISEAVKLALDPENRFPALTD
jgi:glycolate oxidase FAD binding subunit